MKDQPDKSNRAAIARAFEGLEVRKAAAGGARSERKPRVAKAAKIVKNAAHGVVKKSHGPAGDDGAAVQEWKIPENPDDLHAWLSEVVGVSVPRRGLLEGNHGPFEYLVHSFFEGLGALSANRPGEVAAREKAGAAALDAVVWANRGGGKTFLSAVATMLDLVFKPGIEVRVLGGSMEQSRRMHVHLRRLFERPELAGLVKGRTTERRMKLVNGSEVEVLAQSQVSVRGTRVQKLRCDEVELFDAEVWEAAQLVTRSRVVTLADGRWLAVRGTIECLSTMHRPYGIMHGVVEEARAGKRALFRWGVVDVLEACGDERRCEGEEGDLAKDGAGGAATRDCALLGECGGRAKGRGARACGHVGIDDAIRMKGRVAKATWESEMLSQRPRRSDAVLPEFDAGEHVVSESVWKGVFDGWASRGVSPRWLGGMDFGFRAPTAFLWAAVDEGDVLWIVDERVVREVVLEEHIAAIKASGWPKLEWIGVDPAGNQAAAQTGVTDITTMRRAGLVVKDRRLTVRDGLELVRARLRPANADARSVGTVESSSGTTVRSAARLFVHERCVKLIESMARYHYDADRPESDAPVKDGFDHAVDALRYLVTNLDRPSRATAGSYI